MITFDKMGLNNQLLNTLQKLGINQPTQIQELSIPHIMQGKDVIGESATGSGKTLAFGCGIIDKVIPGQGLQALVLTPTRELAEQVKDALKQFSMYKKLNVIAIYGGVDINPQIRFLAGADVVVATPGRFLDHYQRRTINTSKIKVLVLDEADRMLDMGFIDDVEKIIKTCPTKRQTMFFSATISPRIKRLADRYMFKPTVILAVNFVDPSKLKQVYYDVQKNMKLSLLAHMLKSEKSGLIMIFCNTRNTTDFVLNALRTNKIEATSIHGGLSQFQRTKTIKSFTDGRALILICTDVAARGLHIDNVSHVYNYEIPHNPKDYIHRIGRTARAGERGKVVNLLCNLDYENFSRILGAYPNIHVSKEEVPHFKTISIGPNRSRPQRRPFRNHRR